MYYDEYFPFYAAYANPMLYQGERMQEKEFELMKSYYPRIVQEIQERVEEECRLLDYEGSRIYDEYPDKWQIERTCREICRQMEGAGELEAMESRGKRQEGFWETLTETLLCQEIYRRRCRRNRCRKLW